MEKPIDSTIDTPVYTLSVASRLSSLPAHSIRQYTDNGLLIPFKLKSKRHLYSQRDITRLRNIHMLIHEKGLNFSGIRAMMSMVPCWTIQNCPEKERQSCQAYESDFLPCWDASEKGTHCRNEDCKKCKVYKLLSDEINLKCSIRELI